MSFPQPNCKRLLGGGFVRWHDTKHKGLITVRCTGMKLLSEVFRSVKKKATKKQNKKKQPARWSLSLTWLVGFKPAIDFIILC
jgi:hypothetical protein